MTLTFKITSKGHQNLDMFKHFWVKISYGSSQITEIFKNIFLILISLAINYQKQGRIQKIGLDCTGLVDRLDALYLWNLKLICIGTNATRRAGNRREHPSWISPWISKYERVSKDLNSFKKDVLTEWSNHFPLKTFTNRLVSLFKFFRSS